MTAEEREKLYDDRIAPLLMEAGQLCHDHGLSMLAVVEWNPEQDTEQPNYGSTAALNPESSRLIRGLYSIAKQGHLPGSTMAMTIQTRKESAS